MEEKEQDWLGVIRLYSSSAEHRLTIDLDSNGTLATVAMNRTTVYYSRQMTVYKLADDKQTAFLEGFMTFIQMCITQHYSPLKEEMLNEVSNFQFVN